MLNHGRLQTKQGDSNFGMHEYYWRANAGFYDMPRQIGGLKNYNNINYIKH
jgi:hypothetical protein